jgi:hypothetical protein
MYVCVVVHRRTGLKNQIHVRDIETSCCNVSGYKYINLALKKGKVGTVVKRWIGKRWLMSECVE